MAWWTFLCVWMTATMWELRLGFSSQLVQRLWSRWSCGRRGGVLLHFWQGQDGSLWAWGSPVGEMWAGVAIWSSSQHLAEEPVRANSGLLYHLDLPKLWHGDIREPIVWQFLGGEENCVLLFYFRCILCGTGLNTATPSSSSIPIAALEVPKWPSSYQAFCVVTILGLLHASVCE